MNTPALVPDIEGTARTRIQGLLRTLQHRDDPFVTLLLETRIGNDAGGPFQRAEASLRGLSLDRALREELERKLQTTLREAHEGYLAWFASTEQDETFAVPLRTAPAIPGGRQEAVARLGAPWLTPLSLLLAAEPPVVAVFADERRARVFVHDLGEVHEVASYVRALDPTGWRQYAEHSTGMPGRPARGGTGRDDFEKRTEVWSDRFLKGVINQVEIAIRQDGQSQLALFGDAQRVVRLEAALPQHLHRHVLLRGPMPADPDLGVEQLEPALRERIAEARIAEEDRLVDRTLREGIHGVGPVLHGLIDGEVSEVVLPADVDIDIVHCLGTDWIAEDEDAARRVCPESPIEWAPLKSFIEVTAKKGAARIRLVHGAAADELLAHVGPVAGIRRSRQ